MPYRSVKDLPPSLRSLSLDQANLWAKYYDGLIKSGYDSTSAAKLAWYQFKKKYKKSGDKWIKNESVDLKESLSMSVGPVKISVRKEYVYPDLVIGRYRKHDISTALTKANITMISANKMVPKNLVATEGQHEDNPSPHHLREIKIYEADKGLQIYPSASYKMLVSLGLKPLQYKIIDPHNTVETWYRDKCVVAVKLGLYYVVYGDQAEVEYVTDFIKNTIIQVTFLDSLSKRQSDRYVYDIVNVINCLEMNEFAVDDASVDKIVRDYHTVLGRILGFWSSSKYAGVVAYCLLKLNKDFNVYIGRGVDNPQSDAFVVNHVWIVDETGRTYEYGNRRYSIHYGYSYKISSDSLRKLVS